MSELPTDPFAAKENLEDGRALFRALWSVDIDPSESLLATGVAGLDAHDLRCALYALLYDLRRITLDPDFVLRDYLR